MKNKKTYRIGDKEAISKKITEQDVILFAKISGDHNPVHLDHDYAKNTIFKERIAHGFLVGSLISAVIGTKLPGPGTIYYYQNIIFKAPVRINDEITAIVEVLDFPRDNQILLKTTCINKDGMEVITGEALVRPPGNCILIK